MESETKGAEITFDEVDEILFWGEDDEDEDDWEDDDCEEDIFAGLRDEEDC